MTNTERAEIRNATMGCWWPSRAYPRSAPDWMGIRGELAASMDGAFDRGESDGDMGEFHQLVRLYDLAGSALT